MRTDTFFCVIIGCIVCAAVPCSAADMGSGESARPLQSAASGQEASENLSSASISHIFMELARELVQSEPNQDALYEQAMVFTLAAKDLDALNDDAQQFFLDLAARWPQRNYAEVVLDWMTRPATQMGSFTVFQHSLDYALSKQTTRAQRDNLLAWLGDGTAIQNPFFISEIRMLQGMSRLEASDRVKAQEFFTEAYNANKYNKTAFAKLVELIPDQIPPEMYFEHLRYVLREDPLDMEAALAFSQYAERLELFSLAYGGYTYCMDLFRYLNPGQTLPSHIYLPWAISAYNMRQKPETLLAVADEVRKTGHFDIFLEAIVARSALHARQKQRADDIFAEVEQKAEAFKSDGSNPQGTVGTKQLAWFYCFVQPDRSKALDWANRAYANEPNSVATASLLSYALVMNNQMEWAKPLAEKSNTQIGQMALARIYLSDGQSAQALDLLRRCIVRDPSSFVAEYAKDLMSQYGQPYQPEVDPDRVLASLARRFDEHVVPKFMNPAENVAVRFDIQDRKPAFGRPIEGVIQVGNSGPEPLLISAYGLVKGLVRVDVKVRGDLTEDMPGVREEHAFSNRLVEAGRLVSAKIRLDQGRLGRLLMSHPQADLDIEFTLTLDPVVQADGKIRPYLSDIKPITVVCRRPGVVISSKSLNSQYNSIGLNGTADRLGVGRLFAGLLKEQAYMAKNGAVYRFRYADWMPARLESAFSSDAGLLLFHAYDQWQIKTELLSFLMNLDLDASLSQAVAKHLNNPAWPARLMALVLLSRAHGQNFTNVLQWTQKYDTSDLVRRMAGVLDERISNQGSGVAGEAAFLR